MSKGYSKHPSKPGKCRKKGTKKKSPAKKKSPPKKNKSKKNTDSFPGSKGYGDNYNLKKGRKRCPKGYKKVGTVYAPDRPSQHGRVECLKQ